MHADSQVFFTKLHPPVYNLSHLAPPIAVKVAQGLSHSTAGNIHK